MTNLAGCADCRSCATSGPKKPGSKTRRVSTALLTYGVSEVGRDVLPGCPGCGHKMIYHGPDPKPLSSKTKAVIAVTVCALMAIGAVANQEEEEAQRQADMVTVPDLVGEILQDAQDEAQAAGLWNLESEDAWNQGREQLWDRNWHVCEQNPAAGEKVDEDTQVMFTTAKFDETCP
ncbi:PASTA domain-containing protein [Streptomyces sp. NPDC021622]|uniref:PASTA domain-containing protein n=1 Tax=Streptomyces sp. NPDC021622 TaxID=3155013 RepID=UPI0033F9E2FF